MTKIKNLIVYPLCVLLLAAAAAGCSDADDLITKWTEGGEIIYVGKANSDSITVYPGHDRLQLNVYVDKQRIETYRVFWNDKADFAEVQVNGGMGYFPVILSIPESKPLLQVVTYDEYGNSSLPVEITGAKTYGSAYIAELVNRTLSSAVFTETGDSVLIEWNNDAPQAVVAKIRYTSTDNRTVEKLLPRQNADTLLNVKGDVTYVCGFVPSPLAIDTFYSETPEPVRPKIPTKQADRSNWEIIAHQRTWNLMTYIGPVANVIDDEVASLWFTLPVHKTPEGDNTPDQEAAYFIVDMH